MPPLQGFVNGAYQSQSRIVAGELCVNLFPEVIPQGNKAASALLPAPGSLDFATLNDAPGRGIFSHKDRTFTVFGRTLYELAQNGTPTPLGTLALDSNPVTFDTNGDAGDQLMITSGDNGYVFDLSTNVLSNPLASGSTQCGQVDGFLLSLNAATSTFRSSNSLDGLTWNGINIAQRTSASDPWVAMIVVRGEIYLFGNKTGEVWYNAGNPVFPFAERPEGFFQTGIAANFSLARLMGAATWLGRTENGNPAVYTMNGYNPVVISTPALEWAIQTYDDLVGISDAIGWSYDRDGHKFYVLSFPKAAHTWVFDGTTQKWHERGFWDKDEAQFDIYRPVYHASCFGKNLVCDSNGSKVYQLSTTTFTDVGGSELRRVRRTPHMSQGNTRLFFNSFELECDRGVGNANDPGSDPLVMLRYSNDGGVTFGTTRTRQIGKRGAAKTRVRWDMCGAGRDRVWELAASDPVATRWFDAYVDVQVGNN